MMIRQKGSRTSLLIFLLTIGVFVVGLSFWLTQNYALEKPRVLAEVIRKTAIAPILFTSPAYSIAQVDSALQAGMKARQVYWEVRETQTDQLIRASQLNRSKKRLDSFLLLVPHDRYVKIFFQIQPGEIILSMWLSIALAFLLVLLMSTSVFFLVRSFRYMQTLNAMKLDFFHNITHELKTPVAGILTTTELLRDYGFGDHREKRHEMLNRILVEAQRLDTLVGNIIELSTLEQQGISLPKESISLPCLVDKVIQRFATPLEASHATVQNEGPNGAGYVILGHQGLIENVISVLLDNAIKYGGPGVSIRMLYRRAAAVSYLLIEDNGPGIPQADQGLLFQKFFRGPGKGEIKGSGLGLHYAKKIMQLHGGDLEYVPLEKGSCFRIKFTFN